MAAADTEMQEPFADELDVVTPTEVMEADTPSAKADAKGGKKAKKEKGGKPKKGKKPAGDAEAPGSPGDRPTIAGHPRAARAVARAKAWGGLAGFLVGGYFSLPTHTFADAGVRALIAGIVSYVAIWAAAVFVWRRLVVLELKAREQQLLAPAGTQRALPRGAADPPGRERR